MHLPFGICAAGLGAASVVGGVLLPETLHEAAARNRASAANMGGKQAEATVAALLARPSLQGLHAIVFMNGFAQGAMPVTFVLFAVEALQMSS